MLFENDIGVLFEKVTALFTILLLKYNRLIQILEVIYPPTSIRNNTNNIRLRNDHVTIHSETDPRQHGYIYHEELRGWILPNDIVFNIYDNDSTDYTVKIASALGCNILHYDTKGEIRDDLLVQFKNNIWKESDADFVIIID